jgi:5,10-methylenetetrahydromethanopterin reductase
VCGAVTVVDEDGISARRLARAEVATYLPVVAALDRTAARDPAHPDPAHPDPAHHDPGDRDPAGLGSAGLGGAELATIQRLVRAGDHEAAGRLVPDTVLDRFAFSGTPEQVTAQVAALLDAGATRVEFGTPHGLTSAHGIELLGRRVLPAVRGE